MPREEDLISFKNQIPKEGEVVSLHPRHSAYGFGLMSCGRRIVDPPGFRNACGSSSWVFIKVFKGYLYFKCQKCGNTICESLLDGTDTRYKTDQE